MITFEVFSKLRIEALDDEGFLVGVIIPRPVGRHVFPQDPFWVEVYGVPFGRFPTLEAAKSKILQEVG